MRSGKRLTYLRSCLKSVIHPVWEMMMMELDKISSFSITFFPRPHSFLFTARLFVKRFTIKEHGHGAVRYISAASPFTYLLMCCQRTWEFTRGLKSSEELLKSASVPWSQDAGGNLALLLKSMCHSGLFSCPPAPVNILPKHRHTTLKQAHE